MVTAHLIHPKDNVVTAIEPIAAGGTAVYLLPDGTEQQLTALQDIPVYHKLARVPIAQGEYVYKYGEIIGEAVCDIAAGEYVHTHNLVSDHRRTAYR